LGGKHEHLSLTFTLVRNQNLLVVGGGHFIISLRGQMNLFNQPLCTNQQQLRPNQYETKRDKDKNVSNSNL
jgi:hypothetical protein